jgi:lactobin A/cerein 7B family class IIb bacteriocin
VFVENKADATVVLPAVIDPNAELSDAELEAVAGGILPLIAAVLTCMVMGATLN